MLTKFYPLAQRKITLMSRQEAPSAPLRVLVCGPSNASVDEVIRKMIGEKLLDGFGNRYIPKFVRIG
jgi:senataxin